jgi:hypothetical protein
VRFHVSHSEKAQHYLSGSADLRVLERSRQAKLQAAVDVLRGAISMRLDVPWTLARFNAGRLDFAFGLGPPCNQRSQKNCSPVKLKHF